MFSQDPSFGGGFDLFTIVPIFFGIIFVIVIVGIISNTVRHVKNSTSPQSSQYARVVAKRMEVRNHSNHHNDTMHSHSSRTYYYITLEFDNGERKEYLDVKNLFGLLVEGDRGYAAVQGEWIVAFERELANPL